MAGGDGGGGGGAQDDFFDQMMSTLPSAWGDLGAGGKSPWEIAAGAEDLGAFDESALLASRLRQHQIGGEKPVMLQLTDLQRQGLGGEESGGTGFSPLPLFADRSPPQSREEMDGGFKSPNGTGGDHTLFNGFGVHGAGAAVQPTFGQGGSMSGQSFGGGPAASGGTTAPASSGGGGGAAPPRQTRVRARRGQATDPHSIAELRRERIAERMKSLQELVPNANKTDKASMLDEIIDYVKFLQLQVKVLSMSRLGGAAGRQHVLRGEQQREEQQRRREQRGGRGRGRQGERRRRERRRWRGRRTAGDGAAGGEDDGGGHGHGHAVPAGEGPLPHAHLPRLRHLLRHHHHHLPGLAPRQAGRPPSHRRRRAGLRERRGRRRCCPASQGRRRRRVRREALKLTGRNEGAWIIYVCY